ncbi:dephospho-CoA kinase, partial [Arthrospira platensis SPKY1]|nr:dephospho-CoA kinase [Arthrospira platensis SPKY1]
VIDVPEDVQIARTATRDNTDANSVKAIIAAQMKRADRLAKADDVIVNDRSLEDLHQAVDALHQRYLEMAKSL